MAAVPGAKLADGRVELAPKQSSIAVAAAASNNTDNGGGRHQHHQSGGYRKSAPAPAPVVLSFLDLLRPILLLFTSHPGLIFFLLSVCLLTGVEYKLTVVSPHAPPFDLGFVLTAPLHRELAVRPALNSILAALNTVFVAMQALYIIWAFLFRGRCRPAVAALFTFTTRGILGYCTQLPLPGEYHGSAMDIPLNNVSFFLFFSGHVAGAVIASMDMRREGNNAMANGFDLLNYLQALRLLATRGHYTIDLAAGIGAGMLFDSLAAKYENAARMAATNQALELETATPKALLVTDHQLTTREIEPESDVYIIQMPRTGNYQNWGNESGLSQCLICQYIFFFFIFLFLICFTRYLSYYCMRQPHPILRHPPVLHSSRSL